MFWVCPENGVFEVESWRAGALIALLKHSNIERLIQFIMQTKSMSIHTRLRRTIRSLSEEDLPGSTGGLAVIQLSAIFLTVGRPRGSRSRLKNDTQSNTEWVCYPSARSYLVRNEFDFINRARSIIHIELQCNSIPPSCSDPTACSKTPNPATPK